MKSVIAGNVFLTPTDLSDLNRGEITVVRSDGKLVASSSDVLLDKAYQFVVGLGDGKIKRGVWLNPINSKSYIEKYKAPAQKTITFSNILVSTGDLYSGLEVALVINTPVINNFTAEYSRETTASVIVLPGETDTQVKAKLKTEIDKKIVELNNFYGADTFVTTPAAGTTIGTSFVLTGKAGFNFNAHFEGYITSTKVDGAQNVTPVGTQDQVRLLEETEDVANVGYNPNFCKSDDPYGKIFTSDIAQTYNTFTILSREDMTHPFNINTLGMEVTQFIALDSTVATLTILPIIQAISSIDIPEIV